MFNFLTRHSTASLATRVQRYRDQGFDSGGLNTARSYKIDDLDYQLMGADNSCASIAHGNDASTGQWFAINPRSNLARQNFGNSEGTSYDGGKTFITESAYLLVPKQPCRCPPEEVVWHHQRVTKLKADGVERDKRVQIMTKERALKPWLKSA